MPLWPLRFGYYLNEERKNMTPHEAAQSVAWFAFVVVIGIGIMLYYDYRKETKDNHRRTRNVQGGNHASK